MVANPKKSIAISSPQTLAETVKPAPDPSRRAVAREPPGPIHAVAGATAVDFVASFPSLHRSESLGCGLDGGLVS